MIDRIRVLFLGTYGQDAYDTSVSEGEREKTYERARKTGFSVGTEIKNSFWSR